MRPLGKVPRILAFVAVLLLGGVYLFPLWAFEFEAPQYPEGLGMEIYATRLGGRVDLINALNHYVGMRPLRAEDFPEFKIFPIAFGIFIFWGLAVVLIRAPRLLYGWLGAFLLFSVFAVGDFIRWLYDYGHRLDPHAPIEIDPFMPPILGEKTIVNFEVEAKPGLATFMLGLAVILMIAASWVARPRRTPR